jgi:predicted nuclease of predicted toxin-antitoxin system
MKFLADMGVSLKVVHWLREQKHDAIHLRERGFHRIEDPEIFEIATNDERILLTFNLDFEEILAYSQDKFISTIIFRLKNAKSKFVIQRLKNAISILLTHESEPLILLVEEQRIRIRKLPFWISE